MSFRVLIGGCRSYANYSAFCSCMDLLLPQITTESDIIIMSGGCRGTDALAEQYAAAHGYAIERYVAEWARYGRAAGPIRNRIMVECADYVIAFWDGKSCGTRSLISYTKKAQKPLYIIRI
ncbi:MAG: DUF2493 domain-containing protein [Clostridia bacterium]|nr:DUF2493 domain-containing protein [Clostridia bacterium]